MEINNDIKIFLYKTITMYILHFFNNTKKKVIYEESTHVFNRNIMTILLEQFVDDKYTFDDISTIIINDFLYATIENIPINLKKIEINNSLLTKLPQFPVSIETIKISTSRIALSEDFTKYPNLKELKIGVLSDINSTYPPTLIFKNINVNSVFYRKADVDFPIQPRNEAEKQVNNLINNKQSVHISSVNKNICDSLLVIDELAEKYTKLENPILELFTTTNRKTIKDKKAIKDKNNTWKLIKDKTTTNSTWKWIKDIFYKSKPKPEPEEEDEEEEEEEVAGLGIVRITLAVGSTFICCLCPSELRNGASVLLKYGDER